MINENSILNNDNRSKHNNASRHEKASSYAIPTWKRLNLPETLFPVRSGDVIEKLSVEGNGVEVIPYEAFHEEWFSDSKYTKTLGEPFASYILNEKNHGYVIHSRSRAFDAPVVKLNYKLSAERPLLVENQLFIAEEGCKLTVVIDYTSDENGVELQHYGTTRVIAKRGSTVRVVKIQRLGAKALNFDQNFSEVFEGANLELIDIQLGSQIKAVAYESHLAERHAFADLQSLYFGDQGEALDLSYTMKHFGPKTESLILSKGALGGDSKKVFRGNLFFEKGATQSVGREKEFVVLLDEKVKSDSIPALMCSEDDVIGEHAASVGQLDHEKLFYLMSRGLSLEEAKKLVIKASFEEVLMTLKDDGLKDSILDALDRRL